METVDEFPAAPGHTARAVSGIDDAFYARLVEDFSRPGTDPLHDVQLRQSCEALLVREARLLDERRFDEWLALYAPECAYWVPATPAGGDPRREVAVAFDDRRRLEDRIFRLRTGSAWSQSPASRTVHLVTNVEVFDGLMAKSSFLVSEFRAGETRLWSGWCAHRLVRRGERLAIEVKQVNLVDCDQSLRNPSFIL
jgi:benzoate/toluate 1,2-dioxygenase beta subunit